ncbi:hypothetical protein [Paenibacillus sp. P3E]|nr:hypothetical protein [Paenibacillus sp. P3E]
MMQQRDGHRDGRHSLQRLAALVAQASCADRTVFHDTVSFVTESLGSAPF